MNWRLRNPGRVLIITDQLVLAETIKLTLRHGHFESQAMPGTSMGVPFRTWKPHLVIVDMDMVPQGIFDQHGATGDRAMRTPVIALTRRGDLQTKLAAFDAGVDDILTVPFSSEELIARILAIMRRTYGGTIEFTPVLQLSDLVIDIVNHHMRRRRTQLQLTPTEQALLYLLAANAGRCVTRDQILDYVWGIDYQAESNLVDRHVRNLRGKLQDDWHHPRYIATVPGRGYQFVAELPIDEDAPPNGE